MLLSACRVQRVPSPIPSETRVDTVLQNLVRTDSVVMYDSVFVRETPDTVLIERWRVRYRTADVHDTVYRSKTDTIRIPYAVEKSLSRWQRTKQDWGGLAMVLVLLFVLYFARKRS